MDLVHQDKSAQARSNITVGGEHDDRPLSHEEFREKAPSHAYRLLNGANAYKDVEGFYTIRVQGHLYHMTEEQFTKVKRLADRVDAEYLKEEGRIQPFSVEDQIGLFTRLTKRGNVEFAIPPEKLRVMFVRMDHGGCGFYRIIQPVRWLQMMGSNNEGCLHIEETPFTSYQMLANCDMILIPRQCSYQTLAVMQALKRAGKILIYETDDLLSAVPDWNPAHRANADADVNQRRDLIKANSDAFIVSTPELRQNIAEPERTHTVFNGIDARLWPMQVTAKDPGSPVNIMWAGSDTHKNDLTLIVKVLKRILSEFKSKVRLTFIGYAPDEFRVLERRGNKIDYFVRSEYASQVRFMEGCAVQNWPNHLASCWPNICLAPLVDIEFNRCKSELKVIEAWALGCPIVASKIAPYERAIDHGENGFLCTTEDEWHTHIRNLVINELERHRIGGNGLGKLKKKYTMDKLCYQMESALLKIARGKIPRTECNEAIEKRISDLEYEGNFGTGDDSGA